ncbi:sigma-54-dependent transcriptional regulator [Limisalsivibrio acetivorans]|uniref:sigma-54-dependent transcriptional regulator n=1 Tax=Limisalsivibrio acetivorans TaxID=1304888 RepID=UPI0003B40B66|nr:sigma-54 dependent transcriptional regulator [Limisalsivibrio acetivorans]
MKVLLVDDDVTLSMLLKKSLEDEFDIVTFNDPLKALEHLSKSGADAVISDMKMPGLSGLELLENVKKESPDTFFFLITGFGTVEESVRAIKSGASDYFLKPVDVELLRRKLQDVRQKLSRSEIAGTGTEPVYTSDSFASVLKLAERAAQSDSGILITGETGVGKEVLARYIHEKSKRYAEPFVPVNCGNLQEQLFESELFGYRKGAFTGADRHKRGLVATADGGTLFLDEIGEMPHPVQPRFLRFLETMSYYPVGGLEPETARVRVLSATNRNLEEETSSGEFRQDLYYRLNVLTITIPPLRERREDIMPLALHFLEKFSHINPDVRGISADAEALLGSYHFPGNVRELANIIERSMILETGEEITPASLSISSPSARAAGSSRLEDVIKNHILSTLDECGGNKTKAAEILGVDASTVHRRLKEYGVR